MGSAGHGGEGRENRSGRLSARDFSAVLRGLPDLHRDPGGRKRVWMGEKLEDESFIHSFIHSTFIKHLL